MTSPDGRPPPLRLRPGAAAGKTVAAGSCRFEVVVTAESGGNHPPPPANGVVASQCLRARYSGNPMHLARRRLFYLAACAAALPTGARITRAQSYPSRPVRLIVGLAAGGGQDIVARLMGQWLSERLGRQFIVENRPGASGNLALEAVANAPADGHTLAPPRGDKAIKTRPYTTAGLQC